MKKLLAAAALSLVMGSGASAATLVNVGTSGLTGPDQIAWDGSTNALDVTNLATHINFADGLYADGAGMDAILTLHATTTDPLMTGLANFVQPGMDGYFEFRSTDLSTVLLRGDFTNYWITGVEGAKAGSLDSVAGQANLTSDLVDLSFLKHDNFAFSFSNAHPAFSVTGGELDSFQANNLAGTFGGAIPEPGAWALMIIGFGGMGAMLRLRRRAFVTA